mgnify:CR=1 FL=1
MELKDKLEILIKRNGYKKTDFASAVSITYRALANYISGARTREQRRCRIWLYCSASAKNC